MLAGHATAPAAAVAERPALSKSTDVFRVPKSGLRMPIHNLADIKLTAFSADAPAGSGAMQRSDASGVLPSVVVATAPRPSQQAISRCYDIWLFLPQKQHKQVMNTLHDRDNRLGWGTVLHIAPANIPVNFAFSFLMGFLSGNINYVRVPTTPYPQVDLIVGAIDDILADPDFATLRPRINFSHASRITPPLSAWLVGRRGWLSGVVIGPWPNSKPWANRFLRLSFIFQIGPPALSCQPLKSESLMKTS